MSRTAMLMGNGIPPEANALFKRMSTPPTVARKALIAKAIRTLKAAGIWSRLDGLTVYAAADSQAGALNWKSSSFNATNHGAAFTADRGFTGDGVNDYIDTGYAMGSGQSSPNDFMFGVVVRTVPGGGSWKQACGAQNGSGDTAQISVLPYGLTCTISRGSDTALAVGLSGAANIQAQKAGGTLSGYRNGMLLGTRASTLVSPISPNVFVLAGNSSSVPGGFFDGRIAAAYFGRALSDAQAAALDAALQTYLSAIGA